MRTMLLLVLCTLLSALPVLAADDTPTHPVSGLEFGLPSSFGLDDLVLTEMDGYDVSWTRRSSATRGWRIGATLYLDTDDGDESYATEFVDYTRVNDTASDYTRVNIALRAQKLFVSEPRHGVSFILGVGPTIGYSHLDQDTEESVRYIPFDPDYSGTQRDNGRITDSSNYSFQGGVAWDLGFEWRIRPQFSLGARYQWALVYTHKESDSKQIYMEEDEDDRMVFRDGSSDSFSLYNGGTVDLVATFWY